jgi:acyl carrier protein
MSAEELEKRIRSIVLKIAPQARYDFSASADLYRELGVKSVSALDLLLSIEDEFGISIDDEAYGEARSVDKLVRLVGGHIETTSAA